MTKRNTRRALIVAAATAAGLATMSLAPAALAGETGGQHCVGDVGPRLRFEQGHTEIRECYGSQQQAEQAGLAMGEGNIVLAVFWEDPDYQGSSYTVVGKNCESGPGDGKDADGVFPDVLAEKVSSVQPYGDCWIHLGAGDVWKSPYKEDTRDLDAFNVHDELGGMNDRATTFVLS